MNDRIVAVTGASGFIGSHVVRDLAERGARVFAISRGASPEISGRVDRRAIRDYAAPDEARAAIAGADTVVHLAARAHVMREDAKDPEAEFMRANVDSTRALLGAAAAAGVRSFVLLSSIAAVRTSSEGVIDERTAPAPDTPYGRSKLVAEALLRGADEGMTAIALRPPLVYGPGMKGNPLRLWRLIASGLPLPVGAFQNRRSFLFVGNLTDAIARAIQARGSAAGVYTIADAESVSTRELAQRIAASLDRPARVLAVPPVLLRALAAVPGGPLNRDMLERLGGSLRIDSSAFGRATGWRQPFTLEEGIARTSEWFTRERAA